MNCKNLKNLIIFILLGISSLSIGRDNKSGCAVDGNQIIQVFPGTVRYDKVSEFVNFEFIIIKEYPSGEDKNFKIKDLYRAIATPRKILKRPLQVIGIFEYRGTCGKTEHIEELESFTQY